MNSCVTSPPTPVTSLSFMRDVLWGESGLLLVGSMNSSHALAVSSVMNIMTMIRDSLKLSQLTQSDVGNTGNTGI